MVIGVASISGDPIPWVSTINAKDLVTDGWATAQAYADAAFTGAQTHIDNLAAIGEAAADLPAITLELTPFEDTLTAFVMPDDPVAPPGMELTVPDAPALPTLGAVADVDVGDAPVFDAVMPAINLDIARPDPFTVTVPDAPDLATTVLPEAPVLGTLATVAALDIGTAPVFDATRPAIDLAITRPAALTATIPTAPTINELVMPEVPPALTVGAVAALTLADVPTFTDAAPTLDLDIARPTGLTLTFPTAPVVRDITIPDAPLVPDLTAVAPLDAGVIPAFTATPPAIDLDIAKPAALSAVVPVAPTLDAIVVPDAPTITLPDVPTLRDLVLPTEPDLALPEFLAELAAAPTSPAVTFAWAEDTYTSALLTDVRTQLDEWVNGASTGLTPAVEEGIWNRMRDRDQRTAFQDADDVMRQFSVRGFSRPPGAAAIGLQRAMQKLNDASVSASREIAIKQADLEQSNRRFAFEQAINVEGQLISYAGQIAGRALDAAKFTASIGLDIFRAEVIRYQAEISAFQARAEVFKAVLQGELAKLEIFRAQIEGQKLIGEINQQAVALYTARLGGVTALIDLFRARVGAAQANADVQKTIIQAFAAEVGAYGEQVKAKASEYDAYATQVRAEVSKTEVFKTLAEAYGSQIQGFTAQLNARVAEKTSEVDIRQRLPVELFKARTEGFSNIIRGIQTVSEVDRTRVQAYSAEVAAISEQTKVRALDVDIYRASIEGERAKADTFKIQTEAFGRRVDAFKAVTEAQIAAKNLEVKLATEVPIEVQKTRIAAYEAMVRAAQALSEVQRTRVQAYSAEVGAYDSQVKAHAAEVDEFGIIINAEKTKIDVYRVDTEAYKARVDAFDSMVRALVAGKNSEIDVKQRLPLELLKTEVEAYRAELAGAETLTKVEGLKIDRYRAQLEAVTRFIQAHGQEIEAYKANIEGERAKADVFKVQSDAFGSEVQAFKARVEALVAAAGIDIRVNQELPIELYKAQAQGFETVVKAESERVRALGSIYETQGKIFDSQVKGESSRVQADADVYRSQTDRSTKEGELRLKAAEATLERARIQITMLAEAIKAGAQVSAQLASAALSAINLSGGLSAGESDTHSTSNSYTTGYSRSVSTSFNNNLQVEE